MKRPHTLAPMGANGGHRNTLNPALVAQLRHRIAAGQNADDILTEFGIRKPSVRAAYLAAATS